MADHGFAAFAKAKFETLPDLSSQPCIYKAPVHLREVNEECYRPYVVSIGPLYYKHQSLEDMQDCKMRCLKFFLEHDSNSHKSDLEHYLTILRELEGSVRDCYSVSISLSSDEFNGMLLADSAFIICLLMEYQSFLCDMSKRSRLTWGAKLTRDLFLEENQIPLFVLDRLFREAFGASYPCISFIDLACTYITGSAIPVVNEPANVATFTEMIKNGPESSAFHLVDLLRKFCFPSNLRDGSLERTSYLYVRFPCSVANLKAAGVRFAVSKSTNLLDITFSKGVLKMPPFNLSDTSESYFRSMILFEQSHLPLFNKSYSYFVDYMSLLHSLIKTPEDVQILVQSGIIDNWIGSEETVSRLFNGIVTHIVVSENFYYSGVCERLNAYANTRWNKWKAILKKDYFSHPWAAISVIYAIILLLLTLLQTMGTFTNK